MGGEAGVESKAAGGSRFWFRIRAGLSVLAESPPQQQRDEAGALAGAMPAQFSGPLGKPLFTSSRKGSNPSIKSNKS